MRLLALMLLLTTGISSAAEPKPILSPKEIAEGWVMLFDGESTFGWKIEGESEVKDGKLILGGKKETTAVCELEIARFTVQADMDYEGAMPPRMKVGKSEVDTLFNEKRDYPYTITYALSSDVPLPVLTYTIPAGTRLTVNRAVLQPRYPDPLFNGKDLAGWKVHPGDKYKSVFGVTKEGWINVKNGPGDLQTEKTFDDFVLKLDCFSNGKALNSGLFFRCLKDQYQNGYEMQIHNGFKDGDRAKPSDFGTGAIYRRVPARKVVSNDGEWFTMTLVAHGKHLRTFVNGYPTVDWTDDRKDSDNPRLGAKSGKGHLSIQGHDPTTDLNFRNIEIAELRK